MWLFNTGDRASQRNLSIVLQEQAIEREHERDEFQQEIRRLEAQLRQTAGVDSKGHKVKSIHLIARVCYCSCYSPLFISRALAYAIFLDQGKGKLHWICSVFVLGVLLFLCV